MRALFGSCCLVLLISSAVLAQSPNLTTESLRTREAFLAQQLAARPADADAHNALGLVLMETGDFDDALQEFQTANRLQQGTLEYSNNLALALTKTGQIEEAIELYEKLLRTHANSAKLYSNYGLAIWQKLALDNSRDFAHALEAFRKAASLEPTSAEFRNNLAMALQENGDINEAIAEFRLALKIKPKYSLAQINLASALRKAGRTAEAKKELEQALANDSESAEGFYQAGVMYREGQDLQRAADALRRAVELNPGHREGQYALGQVLQRLGLPDEALLALKSFTAISERQQSAQKARVHTTNGMEAAARGELNRALDEFGKAAELAPSLPAAHNNLGWVLARQEKLAPAIREFRRALELREDYPQARYNLGIALWSSGDKKNGSEELRRARQLDPRLPLPAFLAGLGDRD